MVEHVQGDDLTSEGFDDTGIVPLGSAHGSSARSGGSGIPISVTAFRALKHDGVPSMDKADNVTFTVTKPRKRGLDKTELLHALDVACGDTGRSRPTRGSTAHEFICAPDDMRSKFPGVKNPGRVPTIQNGSLKIGAVFGEKVGGGGEEGHTDSFSFLDEAKIQSNKPVLKINAMLAQQALETSLLRVVNARACSAGLQEKLFTAGMARFAAHELTERARAGDVDVEKLPTGANQMWDWDRDLRSLPWYNYRACYGEESRKLSKKGADVKPYYYILTLAHLTLDHLRRRRNSTR